MKLITLNTHSLMEPQYEEKCAAFVQTVLEIQPDLIALQEVSQSCSQTPVALPERFILCGASEIPLRADNHALKIAQMLEAGGFGCYCAWLPCKIGYDRFDEGMAIFSRAPIAQAESILLSRANDYKDWKTRQALCVRLEGQPSTWYGCVHMGWWKDEQEPFAEQAERLGRFFDEKDKKVKKDFSRLSGTVWLLGDFNSDASIRGEGYDWMKKAGWQDSYLLAQEKDDGITVREAIDGWKDAAPAQRRIDQIWCRPAQRVLRSRVLWNGREEPVVSDHAGILVETE